MKKRIYALAVALVLMLPAQAFAATGKTVTTFNNLVSIPNVVKTGDLSDVASFDIDEVNKALEVSTYSANQNYELYYCDTDTVTITLDKAMDNGYYGVNNWHSYYLGDVPTINNNISQYTTSIYDELLGADVPVQAFSGTFTLEKPGTYYLYMSNYSGAGTDIDTGIYVVVGATATTNVTSAVTATPTASKVLVNGQATEFDAYTVNDSNYFKLRDLAQAVSGSGKQFEVAWDGTKNAINLVSGTSYTVTGGELGTGDGIAKPYTLSTSAIYKDGVKLDITAYTINGNNYFKLRDVAKAFNIGVTWDGTTSTVGIDTTISYK